MYTFISVPILHRPPVCTLASPVGTASPLPNSQHSPPLLSHVGQLDDVDAGLSVKDLGARGNETRIFSAKCSSSPHSLAMTRHV